MIADSDAVPSFDIDDTPVTLRTRPTRAKLVSTMLRQRLISQNVATTRAVPSRTTSTALSRLLTADNPETSAKCTSTPSSFSLSVLSPLQSTSPLSASVAMSEEITARLSSSNLGKLASSRTVVPERRRSRFSLTRPDAVRSPSSLPYSDLALKLDPDELQSPKAVPAATIALSAAVVTSAEFRSSPQKCYVSPTKTVSTAAVLDSSAELSGGGGTSRISPIARNNQTLLEHLKRPPSFLGVQPPDTVDVKKLRLSPVTDVRPPMVDALLRRSPLAGDSKAGHPLDQSSSSSSSSSLLSVTLNPPPWRQSLSVRTDGSDTSGSSAKSTVAAGSPAAAAAKSNVTSSRFVSFVFSYHNHNHRYHSRCDYAHARFCLTSLLWPVLQVNSNCCGSTFTTTVIMIVLVIMMI